jgi:hypothetical protein
MIKNVRMNWETESHGFTFESNGDRLEALDFLGDFIGSLKDLYEEIKNYEDRGVPNKIRVSGGCCSTKFKVAQ